MTYNRTFGTKLGFCLLLGFSLMTVPAAHAVDSNDLIRLSIQPDGTYQPDLQTARQARDACALSKEAAARRMFDASREREERDASIDSWDALYYALDLTVMSDEDHLTGTVLMQGRSLVDGLDTLVYHAGSNLEINSITSDGEPRSFSQSGDRISVVLETTLNEGDFVEIETSYLANYVGAGVLSRYRTNIQTGETIHTLTTQAEPWDARHWWPCKDIPHDKADSMRIAITTDLVNTAVCNGILEADTDNDDGTHTMSWFEEWPMVTYLLSMCVAPYNHIEDVWEWEDTEMPMHDWSWGLSSSDQNAVLNIGMEALTALSSTFNTYPFINEKYGHAQYTWGGAMEHQSCSSMGFYNEAVIAHELAHQWFGDKITCDSFHHIWLNEGWATYSEALFFEYFGGEESLHNYMQYEEYWGAGTIYVEDPENETIFDGNLSYSKGSWVLHMLRHVVGDEAFWDGVQNYLGDADRANYRTAVTAEFQTYLEAAHGSQLDYFFNEWIYGSFWPDYGFTWESYEDDGWKLSLNIIQQQVPERQTFTMPIDVELDLGDSGFVTVQVFNDHAAQNFILETDEEVHGVTLDPMHWILAETEELSSMPASDLFAESTVLLDAEGNEIETIPATGEFILRFTVGNQGNTVINADALLDCDIIMTPESPILVDTFPFGDSIQLDFPCSSNEANGRAEFELRITWDDTQEELIEVSFDVGLPEVLLVDADEYSTYEDYYIDALEGVSFYGMCTSNSLPADLSTYGLVIWFTGDSRMALDNDQWSTLQNYINMDGGHVAFTGRHFAESQDMTQLEQTCGVVVVNSQVNTNGILGTVSGPYAEETLYLFNGGAGNQTDMDAVESMIDCSSPWLEYSNYYGSGYAAEEIWCGEGGVVTFGFGLEGISQVGFGLSLQETLLTLIDWSRGSTDVEKPTPGTRPRGIDILSVYPNPFNPTTQLRYHLTEGGSLELRLFNLLGQEMLSQPRRSVPAGEHTLRIDGSGLASGLYVCRIDQRNDAGRLMHTASTKIMLMK
jgi:aminopeptidase N